MSAEAIRQLFIGTVADATGSVGGLRLPIDTVTSTEVILGKRGAGKSNAGVVLAEEIVGAKSRFAALDPVGHWWGMKARPDGSPGLPVYVFGGPHADLPLEHTAGALMAQVVAESATSIVLCTAEFSGNQRAKFVTDFANTLLRLMLPRGYPPLKLVIEEADAFAPQRPQPGEQPMLGAIDALVRRGRQGGIGVTLITQRSAALNKNVTTQADTLIAFRTIGPQDRDAIDEWIKYHDAGARRQEVLSGLAALPNGQSFLWSPEKLNLFTKVQWRRRETFDAASTPKVGEKVVQPTLAEVDLDKLRDRMAATIERVKADDPKELRKQIAKLEAERAAERQHPLRELVEVEKIVEVSVLTDADRALLQNALPIMERIAERVAPLLAPATAATAPTGPPRRHGMVEARRSARAVAQDTVAPPSLNGEKPELGKGERAVLSALAEHPGGVTHSQLAFFTGYSAGASTISAYLSKLRKLGLVEPGAPIRATAEGLAAVGGVRSLPSGTALLDYWFSHPRVGGSERRVMEALIAAWPETLTHEQLCEATGYSPAASTVSAILSKLRKLGLVEKGARRMPDEFMEAIR